MSNQRVKNPRERCYTLLQVGKQQLGMSEDDYRAFLMAHGAGMIQGRISATTMDIGQLEMAIESMKVRGFHPTSKKSGTRDWRTARIAKITAIWIALADAGVVRDRGEKAMLTWCAKHTRTASIKWATSRALNDCIEGLKSWAHRERVKLDG